MLTPEENCRPAALPTSPARTTPSSAAAWTRRPRWRSVIRSERNAPEGAILPHLGIPELLVILFIIILIFGANRLPEIGRGIGKGIRNFKDSTREGQNEKP